MSTKVFLKKYKIHNTLISFCLQAFNGGGKINLQVSIIFYTFAADFKNNHFGNKLY